MSRLDATVQKFPDHEITLRQLASRDPSGNLKYLDWGAKILQSKQALAPEIADVLELFHQFSRVVPHPLRRGRPADPVVRPDIYTYKPNDFAGLRDLLLKLKRTQNRKRKQRERLYHIDGSIEADVVYDSPDLIVRHIKNKEACVHYGLNTKWCISMLRERYFEDYDSNNAIFFFFERKAPIGDEFDKVALMMPRNPGGRDTVEAFTSLDHRVDMMSLATVHGARVFDIFRRVHEHASRHPDSAVYSVYTGTASEEQIKLVFADIKKMKDPYEFEGLLESICCNDATPLSLLAEIGTNGPAISVGVRKCYQVRTRRVSTRHRDTKELERTIAAALVIHPAIPAEVREKLAKWLRRHRINVANIRRVFNQGNHVRVSYSKPTKSLRSRYRRLRRRLTVKQMESRIRWYERRIKQDQKAIEKKLATKKLTAKKAVRK